MLPKPAGGRGMTQLEKISFEKQIKEVLNKGFYW